MQNITNYDAFCILNRAGVSPLWPEFPSLSVSLTEFAGMKDTGLTESPFWKKETVRPFDSNLTES
jgi:hypothetical protein